MKLGYRPNFENNIRTMEVYVKSLGSTSLTAEEEKEIITDYVPVLEYKNLKFQGYYKVEGKNVVVATGDSDGESVSLDIINSKILINENFNVKFMIATKDIKDSEVGTILKTKDLVAEAKALLFKDVITKEVKKIISELKTVENDFETESESEEF